MKKLVVILFLFLFKNGLSQYLNVKVGDGFAEEPSIWINPKNTNNIVAGANISYVFHSMDGGLTWSVDNLTSPYGVWGDPCIFTDTAGNFYYVHLSYPPADSGHWIDRMVCQKSTDQGVTWSPGTYTGLIGNHNQDKAWAVVDPQTNTIYMTWTDFEEYGSANPNDSSVIRFSKSVDEGATWSSAIRISQLAGDCIDSDNTAEGAVPAVGANGEVYVAWSNRDTLFFDKSLDGGTTWMADDLVISEQPGGWDFFIPGLQRCNGFPITKCDLSGSAYHGTIYVNWSDQRNGVDNTDVWISRSNDSGVTWSSPLKVNDDNLIKHQFFTWMDIDQTNGNIYIIFYDRRNYSDENTDVYLAYSIDGGNTFTNQKISETPFVTNPSFFFGDYINVSAYNGKIAPIWTRQDDVTTSVWTALIDFNTLTSETPDFKTDHFILLQNFPNPFSNITSIEMNIDVPGIYSLSIYDLLGVKVADIVSNEFLHKGNHSLTLNSSALNLSSGTYYYSLKKGDEVQTKRLIFLPSD